MEWAGLTWLCRCQKKYTNKLSFSFVLIICLQLKTVVLFSLLFCTYFVFATVGRQLSKFSTVALGLEKEKCFYLLTLAGSLYTNSLGEASRSTLHAVRMPSKTHKRSSIQFNCLWKHQRQVITQDIWHSKVARQEKVSQIQTAFCKELF